MRDFTAVGWVGPKWRFEAIDPDLIAKEFMASEEDSFKLVAGSTAGEYRLDVNNSQMAPCWHDCVLKVIGTGEPEGPSEKLPTFDRSDEILEQYFDVAGEVRAQISRQHLEGELTVGADVRRVVLFQVADAREDKRILLVLGIKPPPGVGPDGGGVGNGGSH